MLLVQWSWLVAFSTSGVKRLTIFCSRFVTSLY
jgi:hypothetical protein